MTMNNASQICNHQAFLARMGSSSAVRYERRNAPDLAETIGKIADAFDEHKQTVQDLQQRVDRAETKLARPGALHDANQAEEGAPTKWTVNGKSAQVLRGAGEIRSHYAKRGEDNSSLSLAEFMRGVAGMEAPAEARNVLAVGTDADGGYMVPSRLMGGVLAALVPESAVLTAGAGILPLDAAEFGAKSFTVAATDTVPTASWRAENGNVSESSPGFRAVTMTPRSLSFYFKISRELLADAAGIDATLTTAIAQAFAKELDRAALLGSGTAPEPRGIVNTSGVIAVANGAAGASLATTRYANFFSAIQGILEANGPMPTAAVMSPRSRVDLLGLIETVIPRRRRVAGLGGDAV